MGQASRIELKPGAFFAVAIALLILPLWFLISLVIAGAFHEMCHYLALKILNVHVYHIGIGPFGASMETEAMGPWRELFCALAGPLGSLMLVPFFKWVPGIALCGLIQGASNLVPIYPLDGGRILKCVLEILKIPQKAWVQGIAEWVTAMGILFLGFWGKWNWNLGWGGVIIGVILLHRIIRRNTSCKERRFGVQ